MAEVWLNLCENGKWTKGSGFHRLWPFQTYTKTKLGHLTWAKNYLFAALASSSILCLNGSFLLIGDFFLRWSGNLKIEGIAVSCNSLFDTEFSLKSLGLKWSEQILAVAPGVQSCLLVALIHCWRRISSFGILWKVTPFSLASGVSLFEQPQALHDATMAMGMSQEAFLFTQKWLLVYKNTILMEINDKNEKSPKNWLVTRWFVVISCRYSSAECYEAERPISACPGRRWPLP